jgi:hypothetical protein
LGNPAGPQFLQTALQQLPGEEFFLRYGVEAEGFGGEAGGAAWGQLRFTGLPSGYNVVSCAGFSSTIAVAPVSWSSLKTLYK